MSRQDAARTIGRMNARAKPAETRPAAPYLRVKHALKDEMARGRWNPGELMPSEAQLTERFGVSRMTVNRALRELQSEGLVQRVQGVGTFAAHPYAVSSSLTIRDLHQEIVDRGHRHDAQVQFVREEEASAALAQRFGVAEGARVFHSLIVHLEDGVPLQCEDRYVNPVWAPDYLAVDFTTTTPTQHLLRVAPLWHARYSIEAGRPTAKEARLLRIDKLDPCLIVQRRTTCRDIPITLARLVHPGSRYRLDGEFAP